MEKSFLGISLRSAKSLEIIEYQIVGSWENNTKHGQGIYAYINGDIYDGFWVEDQKHGRGVYKNKATNAEVKSTKLLLILFE